jgi:RNA polymerase sigma factor (sigma-70 family)
MLSDTALVEAARSGDRTALLRLVRESRPDVQRLARKLCTSATDAEDATQETLWLVYRRIGALRTVGSYSAWLVSIVRRECRRLNQWMRGQSELPHADHQVFAYYTRPELNVDMAAALLGLPKRYREAILLHDFEGHSIIEIAQSLRLSGAAVKSRVNRGRQLLKERLQGKKRKLAPYHAGRP